MRGFLLSAFCFPRFWLERDVDSFTGMAAGMTDRCWLRIHAVYDSASEDCGLTLRLPVSTHCHECLPATPQRFV
jgi:hypothetical protein